MPLVSDKGSALPHGQWVNTGGFLFIIIEIGALASILWWPWPDLVNISEGIVLVVVIIFVAFLLFGIARGQGNRNILLVFTFIIINIAWIIIGFGHLYHLVGLTDTLRQGRVYPTIWDGIYFSLITLTTVGYGDVTPTLQSRSIAAFEALTGYIVMGLLISVLVTIAQRNR